jgi:hypothetical protein
MKLYFFALLFIGCINGILTSALPPAPKLPSRVYRQYGAVGQVGRRVFLIRLEFGLREV